jgi:hypothetical protein
MIDYSREEILNSSPNVDVKEAIEFCLEQLIKDQTKRVTDEIVPRLTIEEVLGALVLAKNRLEELEELEENY